MKQDAFRSAAGFSRYPDEEAQRLIDVCAEIDIAVSLQEAHQLVAYLDMVLAKNEVLNLTSIRDWDQALILHLVDSLTLLPEFTGLDAAHQCMPFCDMGCGAGFPGIPLALMCPERSGVLCDSVKKKIAAVDEFLIRLDLTDRLKTSSERIEVLGQRQAAAFGCVVVRAVSALPTLVEYASPLLSCGGRLIVAKGDPSPEEIQQGTVAADRCGFEVLPPRVLQLPHEGGTRTICTYTKVRDASLGLPRAVGMAQKYPLA